MQIAKINIDPCLTALMALSKVRPNKSLALELAGWKRALSDALNDISALQEELTKPFQDEINELMQKGVLRPGKVQIADLPEQLQEQIRESMVGDIEIARYPMSFEKFPEEGEYDWDAVEFLQQMGIIA